ncbi:hypothetical protein CBS101457_005612 [Exobasidium rhododendri]|nr:hypothetical protein CBS101457_005612 [Exobasidium rhododendri]
MSADPTVQKGAHKAGDPSPAEKIDAMLKSTKAIGSCMLTSVSPEGTLASRAMIPATTEGLVFSFFFNKESGKSDDIETNSNVNIGYLDSKTGDWISISGKAVINTDRSKVKKHFSSSLKAWFDDKKDGKHTGDENDPRVALIDVTPEEIRLFKADGKLSYLVETAKAAVSGEPASGGKMLTISHEEIQLASKLHKHD